MNTTPQEVTQLADDLRHLHLLCETPADFADVDEILAGLADDQRSLYWVAGYTAYCNGRGPGRGREESLGWLAARHDAMTELAERAIDRTHDEAVRLRPVVELGLLVATPGALDAARVAGTRLQEYVARHERGDWGDVCSEDAQANEAALRDGGRLLSAYRLPTGERLWILTEADRSATTALLPAEY